MKKIISLKFEHTRGETDDGDVGGVGAKLGSEWQRSGCFDMKLHAVSDIGH